MAFGFLRVLLGLRIVPKALAANTQAGDMEFLTSDNKLHLYNGSSDSPVVTEAHAATLTNKTLTNPNITVSTNPLQLEDPGAGTNKISLTAPSGLASSYTLTLPPDDGNLDDVIRTNGSGTLSFVPPTLTGIPTGVVLDFTGNEASVPSGWLLIYGQSVAKSLYPNLDALFFAAGYPWGASDPSLGVGTLTLPDGRGRVTAGKDNMGGSAANRLTSGGSGIVGSTLGASGGLETHVLTEAQLAAHDHDATGLTATASPSSLSGTITASTSAVSGTVGGSDGTHEHTDVRPTATHTHGDGNLTAEIIISGTDVHVNTLSASSWNAANTVTGAVGVPATGITTGAIVQGVTDAPSATSAITNTGSGHGHAHSLTAAAQTISHSGVTALAQSITMGGDTADAGSGSAHNNTQPTIIFNKIIKY